MIAHHLKVAKEKLEILEIKENFDNPGKLINFFETKLKKVEEKYDKNIFDDLAFQVESIKKLFTSSKSRKISKIKIYHELNPIKKAMMGNWVDGSCLSFYNEV
jgi:acyl carrier protein